MIRHRLGAYWLWFAGLCLGSLGICWAYVAFMPMAFLDDEYPRWQAKQELLSRCDFGDFLVVGDSRAAVDIAPAELPMPVVNVGLAGTTPVETYVAVRRALTCPAPPRAIILSISPSHITAPDTFWGKSVRYGFLSLHDLLELRDVAQQQHDTVMMRPEVDDGLSATLRIWLYAARFPSIYFGSLVRSTPFVRYRRNQTIYAAVLQTRGQYYFVSRAGPTAIGPEGQLQKFTPLPVLDVYFDRLLALTAARNIPVYFMAMPINDATYAVMWPTVIRDFSRYLDGYAAKYPNFHVLTDAVTHWPDRYFGDSLSHLLPDGVAVFSQTLATCLRQATQTPTAKHAPACKLTAQ